MKVGFMCYGYKTPRGFLSAGILLRITQLNRYRGEYQINTKILIISACIIYTLLS